MDPLRRAGTLAVVSPARRVGQRGRARRWCAVPARLMLVLTALVAVFVIATPGRASAHADLVGTAPGNGEHLDTAPTQVRLRFTERVHLVTDAVTLFDGAGTRSDATPARLDGATDIVLDVPPGLADGVYTVVWRVVSADSHPIHGTFVFSVGTATAAAVADGGALAGADRALGAVFWLCRLLGYAALALFSGGLLFVALCWPAGWSSPRAWRLLLAGWGTSLVCAAGALLLQGPYAAGRSIAGLTDFPLLWTTVATEYGGYVIARIALLASAGGVLLLARQVTGRVLVGTRATAIALAVVAVPATWPGTGHANAQGVVPYAATTAHLLAMLGWLGGLALLLGCVLPGAADESPTTTGRTLSRFSRLAMACVGVLVLTGIYQAWQGLGGPAALAGSAYGALLAFKLATLAVLLTFGAFSRSMVQRYYVAAPLSVATAPVLASAAAGSARAGRANAARPTVSRGERRAQRAEQARLARLRGRLHRAVGIEAGIAIVILGLTSVLVATPPGRPDVVPVRLEVPEAPLPGSAFAADLPLSTGGGLHLVVDPARVGTSRFSVDVRDPAGNPVDTPEVTAEMSLAARGVGPLPIALERSAPGRYAAGGVTIPFPGTWQVRVTVRTTEFDQTTTVTDVTVS